MRNFLPVIISSLEVGQRKILQKFLNDTQKGAVTGNPDLINAALNDVGDIISLPNSDLTDPDGYNQTFHVLQANVAGLYQEIDLLESIQDSVRDLNNSELDKYEIALRDLQSIVDNIRASNAANAQYTDVFFETFGAQVNIELDPVWYKPLPILASSGQINSYLPLFIDPDDKSLKLFPGGDFSRTTNTKGDRLAHVEVEEILGLSVDINHPIDQAVDGRSDTFWSETILTDNPIFADPLQVPWLPDTYSGGAAARVHFRFPFAVPFTEIVIRPFAKYPIHALQAVWNNRKVAVNNLIRDRFFASGTTYWTTGGTVGNIPTFLGAGGWDNVPEVSITAISGRTTLQSNTYMLSGSDYAFHLVFKINRQPTISPKVLVQWFDLNNSLVRADWHTPDLPNNQWFEADKLFIAPQGITSGWTGTVTFVADGSGTVQLTNVLFSVCAGALTVDEQNDLESDALVVALDNAAGTDVWLVVAQPHYEYLQVTIPAGELDKSAIWDDIRLQAEAQALNVISTDTTLFTLKGGDKTLPPAVLSEDGSTLMKEVLRLGGKVREMVLNLKRYATPSSAERQINKYMFVLGAWEIQVRHREYAPQGLFVSKPYFPRGEVRQLLMITDPPLSQLSERIRFWITPRADDRSDKAKQFDGRVTFSSTTESVSKTAETHFTLSPVTIRETFNGTDRLNRIALTNHPYADRDRIWTLQARLTSGSTTTAIAYDPNKDPIYFLNHGVITSLQGYRPIRVTLQFSDGKVANPDLLGKIQPGDISLQSAEILEPATITQELTFLSQSTLKTIDSKVAAANPADRIDLKTRLVNDALNKLSLGGGQDTSKRTQTVQLTALQTRFKKVVSGINGAALSLYWHKGGDVALSSGAQTVVTSGDVLISPSKYAVDAQNGVIIVRDSPPNGNPQYTSFVAYYYYQQDEVGARTAYDSRSVGTRPVSGVDFVNNFPQAGLVTRNVTDYVRGSVANIRPSNRDDLDPDFYPVYEYLVDDKGRIIFADNLGPFGDTPATIVVEYESLLVAPRIIVEFTQGAINEFSTKTPILNSYTLLMQSRK